MKKSIKHRGIYFEVDSILAFRKLGSVRGPLAEKLIKFLNQAADSTLRAYQEENQDGSTATVIYEEASEYRKAIAQLTGL